MLKQQPQQWQWPVGHSSNKWCGLSVALRTHLQHVEETQHGLHAVGPQGAVRSGAARHLVAHALERHVPHSLQDFCDKPARHRCIRCKKTASARRHVCRTAAGGGAEEWVLHHAN